VIEVIAPAGKQLDYFAVMGTGWAMLRHVVFLSSGAPPAVFLDKAVARGSSDGQLGDYEAIS
jgi:hypothetical protein